MSVELIGYGAFFLTIALTYAIMCLGLNVQWGQTGLVQCRRRRLRCDRRLCLRHPHDAGLARPSAAASDCRS